jgi:hypothetical protein
MLEDRNYTRSIPQLGALAVCFHLDIVIMAACLRFTRRVGVYIFPKGSTHQLCLLQVWKSFLDNKGLSICMTP